jgi:hypothetical protein
MLGLVVVLVMGAASPAFGQCNVVTPIAPNGAATGALAPTDCQLLQVLPAQAPDMSFVDQYVVTLPTAGTLTISLQSTAFDAFLWLLNANLTTIIAVDDDSGGDTNALISASLSAGTYIILVNSFDVGETGAYTLTTTFSGTSSALAAAILPSSRSVQVNGQATVFATIVNGGTAPATACGIAPITSVPASFHFQTTNPTTNALTGTLDTPVDIPAGAAQTYVVVFGPTAPFTSIDVQMSFDCTNTEAAAVLPGINTLLLSASATPTPDIIALGATATNDGIASIPSSTGVAAFSVATVNVGDGGPITVSADTGGASLPLSLGVCQTNPSTGQCLAGATSSVTVQIDANTTPTFALFLGTTGSIPFSPGLNRVFVRFRTASGVTAGSTSVAVRTVP